MWFYGQQYQNNPKRVKQSIYEKIQLLAPIKFSSKSSYGLKLNQILELFYPNIEN